MTPEIEISDEMVKLYRDGWNEPPIPTPPAERVRAGLAAVLAGCEVPPEGEPEWGWRGWSDQDPQRGMPLRDEAAAREVVAAHPGTELVCRQVGPWSPVVSDNKEGTDG